MAKPSELRKSLDRLYEVALEAIKKQNLSSEDIEGVYAAILELIAAEPMDLARNIRELDTGHPYANLSNRAACKFAARFSEYVAMRSS